jgi:hypothetical protein
MAERNVATAPPVAAETPPRKPNNKSAGQPKDAPMSSEKVLRESPATSMAGNVRESKISGLMHRHMRRLGPTIQRTSDRNAATQLVVLAAIALGD